MHSEIIDQPKIKSQFRMLLILAFMLEAAGYLAMPYLALHLREAFGISEVSIGFYFMVGIWLRPVWALSASALAKRIPTGRLIQIGALVSGFAISGLALSRNPAIAFLAVIFANFGLAIWSPSTYAYTYDLFGSSEDAKKQISRLNFSVYTGAAVGSGVAALLANSQRDFIFLASTIAFLSAFVFGSVLSKKRTHKNDKEEVKEKIKTTSFSIRKSLSINVILLCIVTAGYWASYAQFNSFFSLFVTDWLNKPEIVGIAFSFLTIAVALFSLGISHSRILQRYDAHILVGILIAAGLLWFTMLTVPSVWITWAFLATLGLSEAFFVLVITHLWAKQSETKSHFMQSLNFSLCNIGMGSGAALGGYLYKSPDMGSLTGFAAENLGFCWIAALGVAAIVFSLRRKTETKVDLEPFFFEKHSSGLTVYCFEKDALRENASLAKQIVSYCENIQDQVWTKKFETAHNSIEQDILLLFWNNQINQPVGFFSASYVEEPDTLYVYHSDGMVLPEYWGKGLLSYFFKKTNEFGVKKYKTSKLINILATGYLYMLSCFEGKKYYKRLAWPLDRKTMATVKNILKQSFVDLPIDENGIIRAAWCKQKNGMKDVWPANLAEKYEFPLDVNYFNGDVLVRLYEYNSEQDNK